MKGKKVMQISGITLLGLGGVFHSLWISKHILGQQDKEFLPKTL